MTALIVLILAYGTFAPRDVPATFQAVPIDGAIIRIHTPTGTMERCTVVGMSVTCEPIKLTARSE